MTLQIGDKVKRLPKYMGFGDWSDKPYTIIAVWDNGNKVTLKDKPGRWLVHKFFKFKTPKTHLPPWW